MEAIEYFQAYMTMARMDPDFETFSFQYTQEPSETEEEAVERWLDEQGCYIWSEDSQRIVVNYDRAHEIHPSLAIMLKMREDAIIQASLDELMEAGILEGSVDEDGDAVYALADDYEEKVEKLKQEREDN